jgi:hypothetical protein
VQVISMTSLSTANWSVHHFHSGTIDAAKKGASIPLNQGLDSSLTCAAAAPQDVVARKLDFERP